MTVVDPIRDERGWAFQKGRAFLDPINGFQFLREAYKATDSNYIGRITVPCCGTPSPNVSLPIPTMTS